MITDNTWYFYIPFSSFVSGKQIIKAMAHFTYEYSHARFYVIEVEMESHIVSLCVEGINIFVYLLTWNKKIIKFPFNTHEKYFIYTVNILVQIDDVSHIVCDKLCNLGNDTLLVWAVQKQYCGWFLFHIFVYIHIFSTCKITKKVL